MPTSESSILANFLTTPAPLPIALALEDFEALFPREHRTSKDVKALYRELQHQVALGIDDVKRNVASEAVRGETQRRQVARERRRAEGNRTTIMAEILGVEDPKIKAEMQASSAANGSHAHTVDSILPQMRKACESLEQEIHAMEREAAAALEDITTTVGDLSDLRYGRLGRGAESTEEYVADVIQGVRRIEDICTNVVSGAAAG